MVSFGVLSAALREVLQEQWRGVVENSVGAMISLAKMRAKVLSRR